MCMIIDTNTISSVFASDNLQHKEFEPILKWLIYGKAKICVGGRYLTEELAGKNLRRYLPLIKELAKFNKVHFYDNNIVNAKENEIKQIEKDPDFDDPHILALAIIAKAKIICSDDSRSFKFIKKLKEYDKNADVPKIYTSKYHDPQVDLLNDSNICVNGIHNALNKASADAIWKRIEKSL